MKAITEFLINRPITNINKQFEVWSYSSEVSNNDWYGILIDNIKDFNTICKFTNTNDKEFINLMLDSVDNFEHDKKMFMDPYNKIYSIEYQPIDHSIKIGKKITSISLQQFNYDYWKEKHWV